VQLGLCIFRHFSFVPVITLPEFFQLALDDMRAFGFDVVYAGEEIRVVLWFCIWIELALQHTWYCTVVVSVVLDVRHDLVEHESVVA
jgi:hypothetical protein